MVSSVSDNPLFWLVLVLKVYRCPSNVSSIKCIVLICCTYYFQRGSTFFVYFGFLCKFWPLLCWQLRLGAYSMFLFFSWLYFPLRYQSSPQTHMWEVFLLCGYFSSFPTRFPVCTSIHKSFVSLFVFYILPYLFSKR